MLEMLKKRTKTAPARTASNPVVAHMIERGIPVTIESYLRCAYTDPLPRPLRAEVRAEAEGAVREAAAVLAEK